MGMWAWNYRREPGGIWLCLAQFVKAMAILSMLSSSYAENSAAQAALQIAWGIFYLTYYWMSFELVSALSALPARIARAANWMMVSMLLVPSILLAGSNGQRT